MAEVSGAEALWLIEGSTLGRLVYVRRDGAAVRPARHVWGTGRLIVRAPAAADTLPPTVSYQVDEVDAATGGGWSVTATGPADLVTEPHEIAHYRRTLPGWAHGPHDTLLRLRPQTVTGFRLAPAPGARVGARAARTDGTR
ncbi:pyridoxamine 5'-phosphate oxidase family protein [Streptomyces beihaiensis]|uniref:Pyridoxamine 5'-phosphate oxidase family protein n=1 Tax=Streptomyces beihaiensis TaxID=2984495 RepID=A0ABT3U087_9ACTN|nr:pyridoxamine 5'-phosphate oxidase family protein [Streptomyces beihaiensis]MCX3061633.1 pyridoxamine 5'-phosphate oxidase family protein [Streptomyces beihaiensis]